MFDLKITFFTAYYGDEIENLEMRLVYRFHNPVKLKKKRKCQYLKIIFDKFVDLNL